MTLRKESISVSLIDQHHSLIHSKSYPHSHREVSIRLTSQQMETITEYHTWTQAVAKGLWEAQPQWIQQQYIS